MFNLPNEQEAQLSQRKRDHASLQYIIGYVDMTEVFQIMTAKCDATTLYTVIHKKYARNFFCYNSDKT